MKRTLTPLQKTRLYLLDLLFPNRCGVCGAVLPWDGLVCDGCRERLTPAKSCPACGKLPCACGAKLPYAAAVTGYVYRDGAQAGVLECKRGENFNFAVWLGLVLAENLNARPELLPADWVIPVPMARRRKRERGYNQAAVIAKTVSAQTGISLRQDCLKRKNTDAVQHNRLAGERAEAAREYQGCGKQLQGARVLLCDDVLTTGITARRCAALLLEQGAGSVVVLAGTTTERRNDHGHRD